MSARIDAVRDLAELGFAEFPCKAKIPLVGRGGFHHATTDERQLLQWWTRWPDADIGVACGASGIVVVDVDAKHGARVDVAVAELGLREPLVLAWTGPAPARSARYPDSLEGEFGGHLYFQGRARTGPTRVAGVELRGVNAYVIAPPSAHERGGRYRWHDGAPVAVDALPALTEGLQAAAAGAAAGCGYGAGVQVPLGERVPRGRRHAHLVDFATRLARAGVTDERRLLFHLRAEFAIACEQIPAPEPGSLEALARWTSRSQIAERERRRA